MPLDFTTQPRSFESIDFDESDDRTLVVTFYSDNLDALYMTDDEVWTIISSPMFRKIFRIAVASAAVGTSLFCFRANEENGSTREGS